MGKKPTLTLQEVEQEISRLNQSPFVKLSQAEQRAKMNRRRKQLADLRWHEKRGRELAALGITVDTVRDYVEAMQTCCDVQSPEN